MQDNPRTDLILSLVLIVVGIGVLFEVRRIPAPVFESFGAHPIPIAVAIALIALASLLGILSWRRLVREAADGASRGPRFSLVPKMGTVVVLAALVTEAGLISVFGLPYIAAAWALAISVSLLLGGTGRRNAVVSVLLGGVLASGTYALFTEVFFLDLP